MRRGAQAYGIHLVDPLVFDVFFEQVRGEHAAFQQELVVRFESIQYFAERARHLLDQLLFVGGQLVQITT